MTAQNNTEGCAPEIPESGDTATARYNGSFRMILTPTAVVSVSKRAMPETETSSRQLILIK